jgi:hypothetical protein
LVVVVVLFCRSSSENDTFFSFVVVVLLLPIVMLTPGGGVMLDNCLPFPLLAMPVVVVVVVVDVVVVGVCIVLVCAGSIFPVLLLLLLLGGGGGPPLPAPFMMVPFIVVAGAVVDFLSLPSCLLLSSPSNGIEYQFGPNKKDARPSHPLPDEAASLISLS